MLSTYLRLNVTVYDSGRTVIRAATRRLAAGVLNNPALREERKRFYREMLAHHRDAQNLVTAWRL